MRGKNALPLAISSLAAIRRYGERARWRCWRLRASGNPVLPRGGRGLQTGSQA
jgi:hypothetical protein